MTVRFALAWTAGGLYVEREQIPRRGVCTWLSLQFTDAAGFKRWCDDDPARFDHPLLHAELRREAESIWPRPG